MPPSDSIRSADRALGILQCFGAENPELSLVEICRKIDLAPSTTTRLLSTLEKRGFLSRDADTKRYCLGPQIAQLGAVCFANLDLRKVALGHMAALRDSCGENVSLYVQRGAHRVCIERVDGTFTLRRVIQVGDFLPINKGAPGKMLLSYAEAALQEEILAQTPGLSARNLARIRKDGYVVAHGEREEGVSSIAAPIFNARNEMAASLSVSGAGARFADAALPEKINLVRRTAYEISRALGSDLAAPLPFRPSEVKNQV